MKRRRNETRGFAALSRVALVVGLLASAGLAPTPALRASEKNGAEEGDVTLVVLRSTAASAGPFVRLRDIAQLPADPDGLGRTIEAVLLGLTPLPGDVRRIDREFVERRLETAGLPAEKLRVEGAETTVVFHGRDARVEAEAAKAPPRERGSVSGSETGSEVAPRPRQAGDTARPARLADVDEGDQLLLLRRGRVVQVEMRATALESGSVGDVIAVRRSRDGARVAATVTKPGVVVARAIVPDASSKEPRGTGRR